MFTFSAYFLRILFEKENKGRFYKRYKHSHNRHPYAVYNHMSEFAVQSKPYVGHGYDLLR